MSAWRIEIAMALLACALAGVAVRRWYGVFADSGVQSSAIPVVAAIPDPPDPARMDAAQARIVARDPLRLTRAPAAVRYTRGGPAPMAAVAPAIRPNFVLKGIVGGPPWQAVLDGIPGQPAGTVVTTGATFDKVVIRSVTRDSVVIQTPDSVWRLPLRRTTP